MANWANRLSIPRFLHASSCSAGKIGFIMSLLMLAWPAPQALAQDYLQALGTPTFTSAEPVELGLINAGNGNLHLAGCGKRNDAT